MQQSQHVEVIQPPALSGFTYNPRLLYAPNRYLPLVLEGLLPYLDHSWTHRWYTAPPDSTVAITAGSTLDTQLRIVPGSVIVGARFCTLAPVNGETPSPSLMGYLIRDGNTQKSFTDGESRFINCNQLVPTQASGSQFSIFAKPYFVSDAPDNDGSDDGGVISVSLANLSTTVDIMCQLLLYVLEPAQIETTAEYGSIMVPRVHGTPVGAGSGGNGHHRGHENGHVRLSWRSALRGKHGNR